MNRTLLLIICDFLLLCLLAHTRWDAPVAAPAQEQAKPPAADNNTPPAATKEQDLVDLMKLSLEDEQARRNALLQELDATAQTLQARNQNLAQLEAERKRLEVQKAALAAQYETEKTALAAQLENQKATLTAQIENQKAELTTQIETQKTHYTAALETTRQNAERLAQQLAQQTEAASRDIGLSRERLAQLQRDLETREADLARASAQLNKLEQSQTELRQQNETLNIAVKVIEQEKIMLRETVDTQKTQIAAEREERIKAQSNVTQLAQGVSQVAQGVSQVADATAAFKQDIRNNRPITANSLFNEYLDNNISVRFDIMRASPFGGARRAATNRTILVSNGKDTYAIFHAGDTPFELVYPAADMSRITVTLTRDSYSTTAERLHFLSLDPRILVVPLTSEQAAGLGVKVYLTSREPFKFPDALLISTHSELVKTKYDPETPFKLDPSQPAFVHMKVGLFSSKRGDIAISKTGEFLGIMVNKDYCALVNNFEPVKTITTGDNTSAQGIGNIINALVARVQSLPPRLQ